jgi:hypothetical protein
MLVYVLKIMHGDILGIYESFQAAEKARSERDDVSNTVFVVQRMENEEKDFGEHHLNREGLTFKQWLSAACCGRSNDTLIDAWRTGEDPAEYRKEVEV